MGVTSDIMSITKEDIVNYWLKLFPEVDNEIELDHLLRKVGKLEKEKILKKTINQYERQKVGTTRINELINGTLSNYTRKKTVELKNYIPFYYFFLPLINKKADSFFKEIQEFKIIENVDIFVDYTLKQLLDQLFEMSYRMLVLEVNAAKIEGKLLGENSKERISYFSNVLLRDPAFLSNLYEEYNVLIHILRLSIDNYLNFTKEVIRNTEKQLSTLEAKLNNGLNLGRISKIEMGAGDTHKQGKTVSIIHFSNGVRIVYKPRNLDLEEGFNSLLKWIKYKNISNVLDFKKARIHSTDYCGWMEFIENKECSNESEIKRFYNRAGNYLCLLYVLNSVDFHYENLIAQGEYPMLIDMESIFHANIVSEKKELNSGYVKARKITNNSVNSIGLLPTMLTDLKEENSIGFDLGGLSVSEEQVIPIKSLFIENIDSDTIRVIRKNSGITPKSNNPILNGSIVDSANFIEELKFGFKTMYSWILKNKNIFLNKIEQIFSGKKNRLIVKSTIFYGQLLKIASHPDFLRQSYNRKLILHRTALKMTEDQTWLIDSEFDDLYDNEIPYFMTNINDKKIINSKNQIQDNLLEKSPMQSVKDKISSLSQSDLERQIEYIEMSYLNKRMWNPDITNLKFASNFNRLTPEKWIKSAEMIGEFIVENSIQGINDSNRSDAFWISTSLQGFEENIWKPDVLGFDLYNGNSGIALFLGYLGKILNRDDFKQIAFQAMEMPRTIINTMDKKLAHSVGAFTGLSGIFYTLNKLSELYDDYNSTNFITANIDCILSNIRKDTVHDVIGGAAGALGVFESLVRTNDKELQEAAINGAFACSNKLINSVTNDNGMSYWPSRSSTAYSGFSHGNSGIIAYLYKLYTMTNDYRILSSIEKALKFERSLYSNKEKNWYSTAKKNKFSNGWCHGAPGILLSKLILKEHGFSDSRIDQEINIGISSTCLNGIGNNPTYCHGDLGNLAILNYASEITGQVDLKNKTIQTYQDLFDNVLSKEWNKKNLKCTWSVGLMIGITGFGYSMLRHYAPEIVSEFLWLK
ncbi:type 2 lanthipeptide synthetase LanM family protein [Bacillus changyiensis]|uniref:type 2 lanthipeptide synthetase LanM family protein n=1 Tax=Bacillus changyiensis TaxID=3004103 RepID=UPI0022DECE07|nr:type 2 lanthipeptide synthetase LanM family protein [Bacillus changyiensis]MDA1476954.1 type 2 lanthipeptide synthetase LanM family protein [Bacillus changyiensis]